MTLAVYNTVAFMLSSGLQVPAGATVEVRREDTSALATLYQDEDGANVQSNPFNADANGFFRFYARGVTGGYAVRVYSGEFDHTERNQAVGRMAQFDMTALAASVAASLTREGARRLIRSPSTLFAYTGEDVPSQSADEDVGIRFRMPAGILAEDGDRIKIKAWGHLIDKGTEVTMGIRISNGLTEQPLLDVISAENFENDDTFEVDIIRIGVGRMKVEARVLVTLDGGAGGMGHGNINHEISENEESALEIIAYSDGDAPGDFTWQGMTIEFWPAP